MEQIHFKDAKEFRKWLDSNCGKSSGIWMLYYKKGTGKQSIEYEKAVEEALCFGWIDSIIKKIDEEKYVRKFTPRKEKSKWSELNKKRVAKLINENRMTDAGKKLIDAAKKNGSWENSQRSEINFEIPEILKNELDKYPKAKEFFKSLAPTYKKHYIGWITTAKREETKKKRVNEAIKLLSKGKKLGLK